MEINSFEKANYEGIKWQKEGILYRSTPQREFEYKVLFSLAEKGKPKYWGSSNSLDEKCSFCTQNFLTAVLSYSTYRLERFSDDFTAKGPFTEFPLTMKINAENYRDRIYNSKREEGVIIKGEINLDDIEVIYSSHINNLENENPLPKTNESIRKHIERIEQDFSRKDLVEKLFSDERREILNQLWYFVHSSLRQWRTDGENYKKEYKKIIDEYTKILIKKLRPVVKP